MTPDAFVVLEDDEEALLFVQPSSAPRVDIILEVELARTVTISVEA